jgi:hypothetical protein
MPLFRRILAGTGGVVNGFFIFFVEDAGEERSHSRSWVERWSPSDHWRDGLGRTSFGERQVVE